MKKFVTVQSMCRRSDLFEVEASKFVKCAGVLDSTSSNFINLATKRSSKCELLQKFLLISFILLTLSACSSNQMEAKPIKTYSIATRQLPPEPAFASTRWVRPPLVSPARTMQARSGTADLYPVMHLKLSNSTLKDAILVLAAPLRYQSFCSNQLANKKISIDSLGTVDELASKIEQIANIKVVVDHNLREVRFINSSNGV